MQDDFETYRAQIEVILASAMERLGDPSLGRLRAAVKERHGDGPAMLADTGDVEELGTRLIALLEAAEKKLPERVHELDELIEMTLPNWPVPPITYHVRVETGGFAEPQFRFRQPRHYRAGETFLHADRSYRVLSVEFDLARSVASMKVEPTDALN